MGAADRGVRQQQTCARHPRTSAASSYLLYVLRARHGQGVGQALFDASHLELARRGHHGLLVWVLADDGHHRGCEQLAASLPARPR